MKVKLKTVVEHNGTRYGPDEEAGDTADLPEALAQLLVDRGDAEQVKAAKPPKAPKEPGPEGPQAQGDNSASA